MSKGENIQKAFLAFLKAGLWEDSVRFKDEDLENIWQEVYKIANEQSVLGLVLAGIEKSPVKPHQGLLLQWIGDIQVIEQQNKMMNAFIEKLLDTLWKADVYTVLVKGQGIAQCYDMPLWRLSGDVDLLLSEDNYFKAKEILLPLATSSEDEIKIKKHLAMTIDGWSVELHGSLKDGLWNSIDNVIEQVQDSVFYDGKVRTWMNGKTRVFLPAPDEDVIFVFSHILQHFYREGIGLRQICDWCRLLWTYRESLEMNLLKIRLIKAGIMTEWKAFGALAVDYLGAPAEVIPFYSSDIKWSRKAEKILGFVLETGNFGHNRDYSYQRKYPFLVYKSISLWKHLKDGAFLFSIFPLDAIKVTWRRLIVGMSVVIQGKRHE